MYPHLFEHVWGNVYFQIDRDHNVYANGVVVASTGIIAALQFFNYSSPSTSHFYSDLEVEYELNT